MFIVLSELAVQQHDRARQTQEEARLLAALLASTKGRKYLVCEVKEEIPNDSGAKLKASR